MAGIFISYRREDTQGWVGRLAQRLKASFPEVQVFHDIAAIRPGEDFAVAIERALSSCQVLLAVIGPRWLSAQTPEGQRRIDDPADYVRIEIATALARPILVVPVLLGGAAMPKAANLPEALQPLARRQGHELSDKRWDYDCEQLLPVLGEALGMTPLGVDRAGAAAPAGGISVGEGMTIKNSRVGDIVGVKVSGDATITPPGRIEVARGAHIEDTEAGDVAGVKKTKKDSQ